MPGFQYQYRPIEQWPGQRRTGQRPSQFKASFTNTLDLLERELSHLQAKAVVIQVDVAAADVRLDGLLRAGVSPRTSGIILSFNSKHGPLSYPCDRFATWRENLRAIALALKALRDVDRYGVTRRAEQYKGWAALPSPGAEHHGRDWAMGVLRSHIGNRADLLASSGNLPLAFRECEMLTHPDRAGGNAEKFKQVQAAKAVLHL